MSLDPLSGLDPAAPASTLIKSVAFVYTPPPPSPAPAPGYTNTGGQLNTGANTSSATYIVVTSSGSTTVTYQTFVSAGGSVF